MTSLDILELSKVKATQLKKRGIETTEDLLSMIPLHYYDFTKHKKIRELNTDGEIVAIYVKVIFFMATDKMLTFSVQDEDGEPFDIVFFNQFWQMDNIKRGEWYTFGGKVSKKGRFFNISNPTYITKGRTGIIQKKYSKIKGMSDKELRKIIGVAQAASENFEDLDTPLRTKFNLLNRQDMIQAIHAPGSMDEVREAKKRLLFESLFEFNLKLIADRKKTVVDAIAPMKTFDNTRKLQKNIPFKLTDGQNECMRVISSRMKEGKRVNSLLQGDVGSGKTMVALFSMLICADSGFQSAIMAPTNVLAKQHFKEIKGYLEPLGFNVVFLTGELKAKEKREVLKTIKEGEAQIVVGTHAVLSEAVKYKNLGLIVVDEEHRFGVKQRESFLNKGEKGVHVLNMSATPIPRSLALSLYGDDVLSLSIKTMPQGRKPILTTWEKKDEDGYKIIEGELKKGRQAYIVCPLIEESSEMENVDSVEEAFKKAKDYFEPKGIVVGMIHGRLKPEVVTEEIEKFSNKVYDILVSTTIVEVGVNVPNATAIIIKSAERFGLAQLHQLRGRVGRSTYQSYCMLLSENATDNAKDKLQVMVETTDGFKIAKEDMKLRGTGNIVGNSQSGVNEYIQLMLMYPKMNEAIKSEVKEIMKNPQRITHYRHYMTEKEN